MLRLVIEIVKVDWKMLAQLSSGVSGWTSKISVCVQAEQLFPSVERDFFVTEIKFPYLLSYKKRVFRQLIEEKSLWSDFFPFVVESFKGFGTVEDLCNCISKGGKCVRIFCVMSFNTLVVLGRDHTCCFWSESIKIVNTDDDWDFVNYFS